MRYILTVTKAMAQVDYNERLKVSRELRDVITAYGLDHGDRKAAVVSAERISKSPLVVRVVMTRVVEVAEGVWRNGAKS